VAVQFTSLEITEHWRQFSPLELRFDPRLTVLTGANATGKTTLLAILAKHFAWSKLYSAAPERSSKRRSRWFIFRRRPNEDIPAGSRPFGQIQYSDGATTQIVAPDDASEDLKQYDVQLPSQQAVAGLFLSSERAVVDTYTPVTELPAEFSSAQTMFEQFTNEVRTRWQGSWTGRTPQQALKQSLIVAALFSHETPAQERNDEAADVWEGFQRTLTLLLPASLGFRRLRARSPEIIVETETDSFIFDELSGGLASIIEMAWQIFLRSRNEPSFTVLVDEPENHLHPELQRDLLPNLLSAFPKVQFVVATHSPFVVTASPDSTVYALDYDEQRRVHARTLDYANKAAGASETLRRVLGLASTMPIWAEERFDALIQDFLEGEVSAESVTALRERLRENGLESEFPAAIVETAKRRGQGLDSPGPE
jgi:predicted ATPase